LPASANSNIVLEEVSKKFKTRSGEEVLALESVSFKVDSREFVSIIGPSGCGKSTVLSLIAGLEMPSSGKVYVDGEEVRGPNPSKISLMFQEHTLLPWRTLLGNVEFGLEIRGIPREERREKALKFLELVGLKGFENKYPREVSGGMKQRASLARSLVLDPEIILMDEPFGALDEQSRIILGQELTKIWLRIRNTVVFVTHSIREAAYLSDRVIVFTKRPAKVAKELTVEVPRPRTFGDERLARVEREIFEQLFNSS
jgi:NitT/TauT family transport system ATP-binding protein